MKACSLPLNYSLKIKTCIMLSRLDTFSSNSPPQPGKVQIPHPSGKDDGQMLVGCLGWGDVEVLN